MSRAGPGSERGGAGARQRLCPLGSVPRLYRGLSSRLGSAGRRNLKRVWEAVVSDVGG